jgi:mannose-1-phosphate guanylyltransferase
MRTEGTRLWAIILAAGSGSRLASLTRALHGRALAKQFAVFVGGDSLLQTTVERILPLVPPERIVVVVGPGQEIVASRQLARWCGIELIAQPLDLDTGPGLLLPLAIVRTRDESAQVVVLPADHHVARPGAMLDAIDRAMSASLCYPDQLCLLGAVPDAPESGCAWILPGPGLRLLGVHAVRCMVEKASPPLAERLHRSGGLLNSRAMVASVVRLWALGTAHLSHHAAGIESCLMRSHLPEICARRLDELYRSLWPACFSHTILDRAALLSVLPFSGTGWSDWDTPRQVFESLKGTADLSPLLARLACATRSSTAAAREEALLLSVREPIGSRSRSGRIPIHRRSPSSPRPRWRRYSRR